MKKPGFRVLFAERAGEKANFSVREIGMSDLPAGDLLIRAQYSSINYKDACSAEPNRKVVKAYPIVPGIDVAGIVATSNSPLFSEGDKVIVHGYGLGVSQFGGYAEYVRVPADWAVKLPPGLTPKEAALIGTAGFTAALAIWRLEECGLTPAAGPVLVTGATGGVGSMAVAMLSKRGYNVEAATGKSAAHDYLRRLGAQKVLAREEVADQAEKPLSPQRWFGTVDSVGGRTLAAALSGTKYGGAVAACGLAGGFAFPATVYPFILRGVSLLGIDSVALPIAERRKLWRQIAEQFKPDPGLLNLMVNREIPLENIPAGFAELLSGRVTGRILVRI
ncbi:MAG TPA: oxidoreductase [Bacilli bacterium]